MSYGATMMHLWMTRRAKGLWNARDGIKAGRMLFEAVPAPAGPFWAARVLRCATSVLSEQCDEVDLVLAVATEESRWNEGHLVFDGVRRRALVLDAEARRRGRHPSEQRLAIVLAIAEQVAKVTYNATNPADEFDHDSGWWIAPLMRNLVDECQEAAFKLEAWSVLAAIPTSP